MARIDATGSSRREGGSLLSPALAGGLAASVVAYVIVAAVAGAGIGLAALGAVAVVAAATARIGGALARGARPPTSPGDSVSGHDAPARRDDPPARER